MDPHGPGVKIGPYTLIRTLGQGAQGCLKEGLDSRGYRVAIKVIRRVPGEDGQQIMNELQSLMCFRRKPNIVNCLTEISTNEYIYIIMDLVEGMELLKVIQREHLIYEEKALEILKQLMKALSTVHESGWAHRDIKPENILVTNSYDKDIRLVLVDFGFATRERFPEQGIGTPGYCAPEVIIGNEPYDSHAADIWSAGAVLYAMLLGRIPGRRVNLAAPGLSVKCIKLLTRMLNTDPDMRPTAREVLESLE
jgi:serine/threonine protein kinase